MQAKQKYSLYIYSFSCEGQRTSSDESRLASSFHSNQSHYLAALAPSKVSGDVHSDCELLLKWSAALK